MRKSPGVKTPCQANFTPRFPVRKRGLFSIVVVRKTMTTSEDAAPNRVRPNFASDDKRRHAAELFAHGFGYHKAAEILGLPVYTVRDWAKAYRTGRFGLALSRNQMRHSEEDHEKVIEMRAQGISWRAIQARTGISASTCRKWVMKRQSEK